MKSMLKTTAAALALLAASSASQGASIFFGETAGLGESTPLTSWTNASNARASFLSNLTGVGTETFEAPDQTDGQAAPLMLTFPGAGTATLLGGGNIDAVIAGSTNGVGRYGTSGTQFWEADSTSFSINFANPIAAFGFYGVDIGDFNGQVTLAMDNGNSYTINNTLNGPGGSVLFWGIIDTENPFTKITFGNTNAGTDYFAFDDMTIGAKAQVCGTPGGPPCPAPEPEMLSLFGLALLGLAYTRKRKT